MASLIWAEEKTQPTPRRVGRPMSQIQPPAWAVAVVCEAMALSAATGESLPAHIEPKAIAAWLYLVLAGSLIAFNAYMLLLANASAGLASSYTFVNPVIAMFLGVVVAGEHITPMEWGAAGVILLGVVLLLRAKR